MTDIIYKYKLDDQSILHLVKGAEILHVAIQHKVPCLWVKFNQQEIEYEDRTFRIFGTGHPINKEYEYKHIGTFLQDEGTYVWHVFEQFPKITVEIVKEVARALNIGKPAAKTILKEEKGYIDRVFKKFSISMTFTEFQATRKKGLVPPDLAELQTGTKGYMYCDGNLYIEIVDEAENKLSLTIANMEYTHHNLEFLEEKLYQYAMAEGY